VYSGQDVEDALVRLLEKLAVIGLLGLVVYILLLALDRIVGPNLNVPAVVSLLSFIVGCYLAYNCLRIKRVAKERGVDLVAEMFADAKSRTQAGTNFGLLVGVTFGVFLLSAMFALLTFNVSFVYIISLVYASLFAYALAIGYAYKRRAGFRRMEIGFNRERLPVSLADLLIAGLMLYLASLIEPLRYVLAFLGIVFVIVAVLSLLVKSGEP